MDIRLTDEECKKIISILAKKYSVRAFLITNKLMDADDKNDLRNGDLSVDSLEAHIRVWREDGMKDYAHRETKELIPENKGLIAPFISYKEIDLG